MSVLSGTAKQAARWIERTGVWALRSVTPREESLVISGFPDSEGNSIAMLKAAVLRYPGPISFLAVDMDKAHRILQIAGLDGNPKITLVPRRSREALRRFLTAEVSMFTHGLFGNPRPSPRKTMVNLWHGGGIKGSIMCDEKGKPTIYSDFLVAATHRQGEILARQCRLRPGRLLITGNPRIDQFESINDSLLEKIGIDPSRPFIVWMPTFRRNAGHGLTSGWEETSEGSDLVDRLAGHVAEKLSEAGIQFVVKPHPSDADHHAVPGAITVTNDALTQSGLLLYEFIGRSSGLLTDYSSIWIDYLSLDRPIAFMVPDEESYADGRGFNPPDALDWLPGPKVETDEDVSTFIEDVTTGGSLSAPRRAEVAAHIGLANRKFVAHSIFDELERHGVFSQRLLPNPHGTQEG